MAEEKKKKGFLSAIRKSMDKSGGCCGSGETCDCSAPVPEPDKSKGKKTTSPEK
jgi:hypothetical protein